MAGSKETAFLSRADADPEAVLAAKRKGGQVSAARSKTRAEIRKMLANMEDVRENAIADYLKKNPEAFAMLYEQVFDLALQGEKWATELMINSTGLAAPKKVETKVEETLDAEEAKKRLMRMMKTEGEG